MNKKTEQGAVKLIGLFKIFVNGHGGDLEIMKIEDNRITVAIKGACVNCSLSDLSYNTFLGGMMKKKFPQVELVFKKIKTKPKNGKNRIFKK